MSKCEDAAAYFWDFTSRSWMQWTGDRERLTLSHLAKWDHIVLKRQKLIQTRKIENLLDLGTRTMINRQTLEVVDEDTILILSEPMTIPGVEKAMHGDGHSTKDLKEIAKKIMKSTTDNGIVKEKTAVRITRINDFKTRVEFFAKVDYRSGTSDKSTRLSLERLLDETASMHVTFARRTELHKMSEDVGEALGCDLVWDGGQSGGSHLRTFSKPHHLEEVMKSSKALIAVAAKYPWIEALIKRTLKGDLAGARSTDTKLECLEENEAKIIGKSLMPCLKSRKTPRAGVEKWEGQNLAIKELFMEFPWMKEMFVGIAEGVVKSAPWGLFWRVFLGAMVSIVDIVTDVVVAYTFWTEGRKSYFWLTVTMILVSMVLQGSLVVGQNYRRGLKILLLELIPVVTAFKPATDAYKVASGQKMASGNFFDPLTEMTYAKCIEMFAESIPGVLIQIVAVTTTEGSISSIVWTSLAASAATTGYTAATISYNYDTDPSKREEDPNFFGYVPETMFRGFMVFFSMSVFSACMLLVRSVTLILLGLCQTSYAIAFFSLDMVVYILVKIIMGDFHYWIPGDGFVAILVSLSMRVITKTIVDFTQIVHYRHPYELGGLNWCFGLILSLVALPGARIIYDAEVGNEQG